MARSLEADARHCDRLELTGEQQTCEQLGVFAVVLDPVARRARRLRGRDDVEAQTGGLGGPVEREAGRAGFIAGMQRLRQPREPAEDVVAAAGEAGTAQLAALNVDRGGVG